MIKRLVPILVLALGAAARACPFCKDSVPNSDAQAAGSLPGGMNVSVYFMLAGLFVTLGLIMGIIIKGVRDTNKYRSRGFPLE